MAGCVFATRAEPWTKYKESRDPKDECAVELGQGVEHRARDAHRRLVHGVSGHVGRVELPRIRGSAEDTAATRTTLAVATNNAGPRTRVTLTAHVTAARRFPIGRGELSLRGMDLGSASWMAKAMRLWRRTTCLRAPIRWSQSTGPGRLSELGLEARAGACQRIDRGGIYRGCIAHVAIHGSGRLCEQRSDGNAGQRLQRSYVSLSCNGLPVNTTCTFTPVNVPRIAPAVASCTPGTSVMQIQTLAPSPGTRRPTVGRRHAALCFRFPGIVWFGGSGRLQAPRLAQPGAGNADIRRGHGNDGLRAALSISQSRATGIIREPQLAATPSRWKRSRPTAHRQPRRQPSRRSL
jgi:hypothetical protein